MIELDPYDRSWTSVKDGMPDNDRVVEVLLYVNGIIPIKSLALCRDKNWHTLNLDGSFSPGLATNPIFKWREKPHGVFEGK